MDVKDRRLLLATNILGQGVITTKLMPVDARYVAWNLSYAVILSLIYFWALYTASSNEEILGYRGYTFISQISYWENLHGIAITSIILSFRLTHRRHQIYKTYKRLTDISLELEKLIGPIKSTVETLDVAFLVLLGGIFSVLIFDLCQAKKHISICLWICLYMPGISATTSLLFRMTLYTRCSDTFANINNYLKRFTYPELTGSQTYALRQRGVRPRKLLRQEYGEQINLLDKLLIYHDEICQLIRELNTADGLDLFIYIQSVYLSVLSLLYTSVRDTMALYSNQKSFEVNTRAADCWSVIHTIMFLMVIRTAAGLKENSKDTKEKVFELVNLYPELEELVDVYILQLEHQTAYITAAEFFEIDKPLLMTLVSSAITYVIILVTIFE